MRFLYNPFLLYIFIFLLGWPMFNSCAQIGSTEQQNGPTDSRFPYDLSAPKIDLLPRVLEEISGITFHPKFPGLLFAIEDETGNLYAYDLENRKIAWTVTFGKNGDYEEVTTDGDSFYVLRSDGSIFSFGLDTNRRIYGLKHHNKLLPAGEYEALAFSPAEQKLIAVCKVCKVDRKEKRTTGYKIDILPDDQLRLASSFSIDMDDLQRLDRSMAKTFKPSAIAYRQLTREWYVLSSIDRAIVVLDSTFTPKHIARFKRKDYKQPEGITFDSTGHLYISSEGGDITDGKLYKFNLK